MPSNREDILEVITIVLQEGGQVRKTLYLGTSVLLLSVAFVPQAAFADDQSDDDYSWEHIFEPNNNDSEDSIINAPDPQPYDPTHKHKMLHDQYGDVDSVGVPSIVIRPGVHPDPTTFDLPIIVDSIDSTSVVSSLGEVEDSTTANAKSEEIAEFIATKLGITFMGANESQTLLPTEIIPANSKPIQIKDLVLSKKTPADEFLDGAVVFGVALGALALVLLAITGFSAIRLRREAKEL